MVTLGSLALTPGEASGELLVLDQPLSFWGGVDADTGIIIDRTHPQCGREITGCILAMRRARGSSSSASTLVECQRRGRAPAGIVLAQADAILVMGSLVGSELYGAALPIVVVEGGDWLHLAGATSARIAPDAGASALYLD